MDPIAADQGAEGVLDRLAGDLDAALGEDLLSLAVHGSWTAGDFTPGRSDLDLVAVLVADPTPALLPRLARVHAGVERDHPGWAGHIEVDYVAAGAVADVVRGGPPHAMLRISPGETLHLLPASRHHLLNWAAARAADTAIAGVAPATVLPEIDDRLVEAVVLDHVRAWPQWVLGMHTAGGQAYAVLTVCRAAVTLLQHRQVSKRAAAAAGAELFPERAELIGWARAWWYEGGPDDAPGRPDDVRRFVTEVADLLGAAGPGTAGD